MCLHKDCSSLGLPLFESEMRRRLFWQIAILDGRSAELAGSSRIGELWPTEVKRPMNVNDNELWPGMTESPPEHDNPTEMSGFLLRHELGQIRLKYLKRDWSARADVNVFSGSPEESEKTINEVEKHLNDKFLLKMDPSIPSQYHCIAIGKTSVWILR